MLLRARMVKPISRIVGGIFYPASLVISSTIVVPSTCLRVSPTYRSPHKFLATSLRSPCTSSSDCPTTSASLRFCARARGVCSKQLPDYFVSPPSSVNISLQTQTLPPLLTTTPESETRWHSTLPVGQVTMMTGTSDLSPTKGSCSRRAHAARSTEERQQTPQT